MSLRRILLVTVLSLVAIGQITSFVWIYSEGQEEMEEVLDSDLLSQAGWTSLWLKNLPAEDTEKIAKNLTERQFEGLPADWVMDQGYHLVSSRLQLWDAKLQRWWPEDLPQDPIEKAGFGWHDYGGLRWRTFDLVLDDVPIRARLWQSLDVRDVALEETLEAMLVPNLTVLVLLLFILGIVIHRGLSPLAMLAQRMSRRTADDLDTIPTLSRTQEIQQLTQSLNDWILRLNDTLQRERGFASDVAHELRSPLAALQLQLDEFSADQPGISQARNSVRRLARVVDQLLSLARLEHRLATLRMQPVALDALLEDLLGEMADQVLAKGKEIELIGQAGEVQSEPILLSVVLRNLLENASKYSDAGSLIEVELRESDSDVRCLVRDRGAGIPAARRSEVQQRFVRLDTGRDGAGLGLAIVGRICDALHIDWQLQDRDDGQSGLQVCLRWPR